MILKYKNAVKKLLTGSAEIERTEDEKHYIHKPTNTLLERTTSWISGGAPFVLPKIWEGCLPIGSMVDQIVRDFFVDGRREMSPFMYLENVQGMAYVQLLDDLEEFKHKYCPQWTVYADRVFLFSLELGVAGEVDLLLVNEETGQLWIVDMKTSRGGTKTFSKRYGKNEPTKLEKYRLQLNTYRFMAEEMSGLPIDRLSLLPIKVFYPPNGFSTREAYFEPLIDLEFVDPVEERNRILSLGK